MCHVYRWVPVNPNRDKSKSKSRLLEIKLLSRVLNCVLYSKFAQIEQFYLLLFGWPGTHQFWICPQTKRQNFLPSEWLSGWWIFHKKATCATCCDLKLLRSVLGVPQTAHSAILAMQDFVLRLCLSAEKRNKIVISFHLLHVLFSPSFSIQTCSLVATVVAKVKISDLAIYWHFFPFSGDKRPWPLLLHCLFLWPSSSTRGKKRSVSAPAFEYEYRLDHT